MTRPRRAWLTLPARRSTPWGRRSRANSPTSTGGAVTAYGVSPALPAGLSMDDDTGIITGTPTAVTATATYTVMASNLTGSATATLSITVNAAAAGVQFIPNMNQWITPLAPQGAQFQPLVTPWLVNGNPWLAGQAVSSVVKREHPAGSDQRVQPHFLRRRPHRHGLRARAARRGLAPGQSPAAGGLPANSPSSEYVFIYDISTGAPVYQAKCDDPQFLQRDSLRSNSRVLFTYPSGMGDFPFGSNGYPNPSQPPA